MLYPIRRGNVRHLTVYNGLAWDEYHVTLMLSDGRGLTFSVRDKRLGYRAWYPAVGAPVDDVLHWLCQVLRPGQARMLTRELNREGAADAEA